VKLTVWQFLAIIGALVGLYLIYSTWFVNQDGSGWIQNWNSSITGDEKRVSTTKSSSGQSASATTEAEPEKNVW
jgi:hypothetical protein